jgi:ABC-2 type transport system permease protein
MWSLITKEFKLRLKEKKTYFLMIILPILFIILMGSTLQTDNFTFNIHCTDLDGTQASKSIVTSFNKIKGFEITNEANVNDAVNNVKSNKYPVYFVIPKGFEQDISSGKQPQILIYYDQLSTTGQAFLSTFDSIEKSMQQSKIDQYVKNMAGNGADAILKQSFTIKTEETVSSNNNGITQIISGYTVMFAFFIITIMTQSFFKDRESGMLARLTGTPLKKHEYMIGMWVPNYVIVLIQVTLLYAFGHFYYNMPLGNLPALIVITLLLAFVGTALGLLLTFISENQPTVVMLNQIVILGGAAISGLWFSTDILPPIVQKIAMFFPQYWIEKSYVSIFGQGANLFNIWENAVIILAMGIIFFVFAYFEYNKFFEKATS